MTEFVKTIKLNFEVDDKTKSSVDDIKKTIDETLSSSIDKDFKSWAKELQDIFDFDMSDSIKKADDELKQKADAQLQIQKEIAELKRKIVELEELGTETAQQRIEMLEDEIEKKEKLLNLDKKTSQKKEKSNVDSFKSGFKDEFKRLFNIKDQFDPAEFGKTVAGALKKVLDKAWAALKQLFKDAWAELKNIVQFSRLSDPNTRELAFQYGFNSSQAYGFTKAMGALGFESEEDLWFANAQEIELFRKAFDKYSQKYTQLYDSGTFEEMLNYQVEMAEFEEDIKLELVQFFMDNKDVLKWGLQALLDISQVVLKIFDVVRKVLNGFTGGGGGTTSAAARALKNSDVIQNYSSTKNTSIKVDNTYNNVSSQDRAWLQRAGEQTYEQMVAYLNGGN